ncbi:vacuolar protein sorting-associated protein 18 homolog [Rhopilema esculentum]|uniref:vacuolar protein sorting-associated protein 18 homolog n=1 Tax=Rhopilema esculentum TaxID=499914 RepID=UPI0031DE774B
MGDLMYQYENVEVGDQGAYSSGQDFQEPITSGFVSVKTEIDIPIFKREIKNYRPPANIVDFKVSNNIAAIAHENNVVTRLDLSNPSEVDNVEISKRADDKIHKIFLDPTGRHLIVCMQSLESYHLGRNNKKAKALQKFKSHQIEAVGWNKINMSETATGEILIGTSKGTIYETSIEAEEKFFIQMGAERYIKMLYDVNQGRRNEEPISGIHVERFPGTEKRMLVMVATPSQLYQFIGDTGAEGPIFAPVFAVFEPNPAPFLELPGTLHHSDLAFYFSRPKEPPKLFAWITGPGVYFGGLDFQRSQAKENITLDTRLLPPTEPKLNAPLSIAVTEFHCILLYPDRFEAICTLDDQEVFAEHIPSRFGRAIGMCTDYVKKTVWVFTELAIYQYVINKESRNVWRIYLDQGKYELAKDYCRDPAQTDIVIRKQAEQLFSDKRYEQAAAFYALTQISFEEVALKFIQVKTPEALKTFLLKKMVNLKPQDRTQMTMILTWLIELYLNQIGELKDQGSKSRTELERLQEDFRKLLAQSKVKHCLEQNRQLTYDLLASHGDTENMIFFAMIMQDYGRVISHHIQQDDFKSALEVLRKQGDNELFYKFSPVLMQQIPKETVDAWKQRNLDPRKLIPALVTHEQQTDVSYIPEAIEYLEHCVYSLLNEDQAIHNYLISLYCKLDDEKPLLRYLIGRGDDQDLVPYDMKYALRLCSENNKQEACVHIYSAMGLYEEAVDLALKVDVEKAKIYADKPEEDDALRKKLWLKVARHVVESQLDIGRAMELLNECNLLKIEDILPFFPDFVTIDQFKEAICKSLQEYNKHIDQLKNDMQDATDSARVVREEIHEIRNRYGTIGAHEKCAVCQYPLLTRSFYFFPCSHVFHSDCLVNEVSHHIKDKQRKKIEEIQAKLANLTLTSSASMSTVSGSITPGNASAKEQLKSELDDIVASECIYCGDVMIRSLDKPFIEESEYDSVVAEWN